MAEENVKSGGFRERLKDHYRLVIMNNETFEEVGSYKINLLNVYILISTIIVTVAFLVVLVIIFTPVKRYIPGYGDVKEKAELSRLNRQVTEMRAKLDAQQAYTDNFRKILVGEIDASEIEEDAELVNLPDSLLNVERIEEDERLRKEIEDNERDLRIQQRTSSDRAINSSRSLSHIYFIPPVSGIISEGFAADKNHIGVDILSPLNTPVKAVLEGYVFLSDWTLETGHTLGVQHSNNLVSFYKHNSANLKKVGDYVKSGEAVAIVGNTGKLTNGPHLHFELWYQGRAVDPEEFIRFE